MTDDQIRKAIDEPVKMESGKIGFFVTFWIGAILFFFFTITKKYDKQFHDVGEKVGIQYPLPK